MQASSPSPRHTLRAMSGQFPGRATDIGRARERISNFLLPVDPRAHTSMVVANNEASLVMDDFAINTPTFVTLDSAMKMKACEVFWRTVNVQLVCSRESSTDQSGLYSAVLCVRRHRRHGLFRSSELSIALDRRMHPIRLLASRPKDICKFTIGIEFGWKPKQVWFRAPNHAVFEEWTSVIRAALQPNGGSRLEHQSLAKWIEGSAVSTVSETPAKMTPMSMSCTSTVTPRTSTFERDSYAVGLASSYHSEIPDDEWIRESEEPPAHSELYELCENDRVPKINAVKQNYRGNCRMSVRPSRSNRHSRFAAAR